MQAMEGLLGSLWGPVPGAHDLSPASPLGGASPGSLPLGLSSTAGILGLLLACFHLPCSLNSPGVPFNEEPEPLSSHWVPLPGLAMGITHGGHLLAWGKGEEKGHKAFPCGLHPRASAIPCACDQAEGPTKVPCEPRTSTSGRFGVLEPDITA